MKSAFAVGLVSQQEATPARFRPSHHAMLGWLLLSLLSGCATLLPTNQSTTKSHWNSYDDAKAAFDKIVPAQTKVSDLAPLGFDPTSPNVKVLTYLDIIERFMPNQSITRDDLDPAVRQCIDSRENSRALELEVSDVKGKRIGNVPLDIFGFRRKTHETGWRFKALLLIHDETVVYKLSSGESAVDRMEKRIRPLGPLQELDGTVIRGIPGLH